MKEFEKFWEDFRKKLDGEQTIDDIFFARDIWKAALEWAKKQHCTGVSGTCTCHQAIEKELESEYKP